MKYLLFLIIFLSAAVTGIIGQEGTKSDFIDIKFSRLLENPELYSGKKVRTIGYYTASFETAWFAPKRGLNRSDIFIDTKFEKDWKSSSSPKALKKFENDLDYKNDQLGKPRTTKIRFVGIFEFLKVNGRTVKLPTYRFRILYLE